MEEPKIDRSKFIRRIDFYVNLFFKSVFFCIFIWIIISIIEARLGVREINLILIFVPLLSSIIFFIKGGIKYEDERFDNQNNIIQSSINETSTVPSNKISKHNNSYSIVLITYIIILFLGILVIHARKSEFVILLTFILLLISLIMKYFLKIK